MAIQVQKLNGTGGTPLHRAKEELGHMGRPAAQALRRVFDANFTNQRGIPFLENALDAAALNPTDEAHELLLAALDHPMEAVRQRAISGIIAGQAHPEDFDKLKDRFETNEAPEVRRRYLRAMFEADQERAEQASLVWIQRGEYPGYLAGMMSGLQGSSRPETGRLCADLFQDVPSIYKGFLAAVAARFGDLDALDFLHEELESGDAGRQMRAITAFGSVGMYAELKPYVSRGLGPNVRLVVLQNLAPGAETNLELQEWISAGLSDPDAKVRDFTLLQLCTVGYAPALDQALEQLSRRVELMQSALLALQPPMNQDEKLAARAFGILSQRYAEELAAAPAQFHGRTLKAIGLVPGRASASFLRERALELGDLQVEGMGVHTWVMISASNTGAQGLAYVNECLSTEEDPVRRIDLLDALAAVRSDATRDWLFGALDQSTDPYEGLFIAAQLIRMGPSTVVASRVKQYCFARSHLETRQALQALLWKWY